MKKIPRQLTIRGSHWHVVVTRTLQCNGEEILGLCDPSTRTIFINKKQSVAQQWRTFCHEFCHSFEFEFNIKLGHPIIEKLEAPLADFILNNFFIP